MAIESHQLEEIFTYHQPTGTEDVEQYQRIRVAAREFAQVILDNTPVCGDQQAALRHVRVAMMTANAAIALGGTV